MGRSSMLPSGYDALDDADGAELVGLIKCRKDRSGKDLLDQCHSWGGDAGGRVQKLK